MNRGAINRAMKRSISVGSVVIGGDAPIRVQSMTNTDSADVAATLDQIRRCAIAGAELMRVSIPNQHALDALPHLIAQSPVPLVADIHFDYRLAIGAIRAGIHKLRINPGNIGSAERLKQVITEAQLHSIPIRVGINAGSLEKDILKRHGHPTADALAESALRNIEILTDLNFHSIILSLKSSDVLLSIDAYRKVSAACDYPLHIGITEAGTHVTGAIRSAVGLGIILHDGIGDTIRVSLAADPVEEIYAAYTILDALGLRRRGPRVIACPTCGRTQIDIISLAKAVEDALRTRQAPLTVAVMGCVVNGPGEAKEADLGIAGGRGDALLFRKGIPIRTISEQDIIKVLLELFDEVAEELADSGSNYIP